MLCFETESHDLAQLAPASLLSAGVTGYILGVIDALVDSGWWYPDLLVPQTLRPSSAEAAVWAEGFPDPSLASLHVCPRAGLLRNSRH